MTTVQSFNCVFCKEQFDDKEALQIHFRKHGDPNFNQSKSKVHIETQNATEKAKDDIEMVSCDVCNEIFPTISKAITHKHKVHPNYDTKYFCPWCGKLFTMKHLYNKHMKISHYDAVRIDDKSFNCDSCEVEFYVPSAMLYHNKLFHQDRQDLSIPAIGQSKKLKLYNEELLQIYYCAFCGEEYDNKINLHKHTSDDHSDENQCPEEVLRCPLCEAVFYHLDAYEVHLTFHSCDDVYSEKNELIDNITEFSLETVPPMVEKVEPAETDNALDIMGIENFMEMKINESIDNNNPESDQEAVKVKSKKHKKHKKSKKKEAITLNEFLSMNQDVFGEGLDFQGIEEVPTQAVTKRLKVRKQNNKITPKLSELDKLKKQGITVKMKSGKGPPVKSSGTKLTIGNPAKITKNITCANKALTKNNVISTSNEVLSKLLNQSNNQIKIIKKSSQNQQVLKPHESDTPENIEIECDIFLKSETEPEENSEETENIENNGHKDDDSQSLKLPPSPKNTDEEFELNKNGSADILDSVEKSIQTANDLDDGKNKPVYKQAEDSSKNKSNQILPLKNLPQEVNFKPLNQSKECVLVHTHADQEESSHNVLKHEKSNDSLNALKHLSHLITVKPMSKEKNYRFNEEHISDTKQELSEEDKAANNEIKIPNVEKKHSEINPNKKPVSSVNTHNLKKLSKHITIKSIPQKTSDKMPEMDRESPFHSENEEDETPFSSDFEEDYTEEKTIKENNVQPLTNKVDLKNKILIKNDANGSPSNNSLLKSLTNVTVNSISTKHLNQQTAPKIKHENVNHSIKKEELQEMEVFNIDDSDDDNDNIDNSNTTQVSKIPVSSQIRPNMENKSHNVLNNLSKQVTVKSLNQQTKQNYGKVTHTTEYKCEKKETIQNNKQQTEINKNERMFTSNVINQKNAALQQALKTLGKNITVKSRNSSPSMISHEQEEEQLSKNMDNNDEYHDSDSQSEGIKITEMNDDNISDDDFILKNMNSKNNVTNKNVVVEYPNESDSDNEIHKDDYEDEDLSDLESQIQVNKSIQNSTKHSTNFNPLRNVSKNITIKSLNEHSKGIRENAKESQEQNSSIFNQQLKSNKQILENNTEMRPSNTVKHYRPGQSTSKQNISNHMQTVNQEVTVKTVQTKTVVQEITTTVTKTIRTINQTVKQEMNSNEYSTAPAIQQKINFTPKPQSKNFQGNVKQSAVVGTKIRNAVTKPTMSPVRPSKQLVPVRPSNQIIPVRPSNQLVPVRAANQAVAIRPGTSISNTNNPRMPTVRKVLPSTSHQKPTVCKPLKISPQAINSPIKKVKMDETAGPFSCFKKSKESLIPVSEVPDFGNELDGNAKQFTAVSQVNKSCYSSVTKRIKGDNLVTSKQVKSEICSQQQITKLGNVSGLKIMKTSQTKQAQVEEKTEGNTKSDMNASKRTTLEAIEKLQKQGLLVKRPRLEVDNDKNSENDSWSEDDE